MERTVEYRKKHGADVWHWCANCAEWPTDNYTVTFNEPAAGALDPECRAKERAGDCTSAERRAPGTPSKGKPG